MTRASTTPRAALLALIVLATSAPAGAARAWCRLTTSERVPTPEEPCVLPNPSAMPPERFLEWKRPCSAIALSVAAPSDDLSLSEVASVFERSIATWEAVECDGSPLGIDIELLSETSTCTDPLYRTGGSGNVNAVMFVHDWADREYDPSAFAVTTVWHLVSSGEIVDVDMEINERRGPYGICPPHGCVDGRTVDLENVVTHELGHYLGLAHSQEVDATMFQTAFAGETIKRDLTDDDVAGICAAYPPGKPGGECEHEPPNGLVLHCDTGCSISARRSASGTWWPAAVFGALALLALRRARTS